MEIDHRIPNEYHGEEYPYNFQFFPNGHQPYDGEIVGLVESINESDTHQDILAWFDGTVLRMSVKRLNRFIHEADTKNIDA